MPWLKSSTVEPEKCLTLTRRPFPHNFSSTLPFSIELPAMTVVLIGHQLLFCSYLQYSSFSFLLNSLRCSSIEAFAVVLLLSPLLFSQSSFEQLFGLSTWLCCLWSYLGTFTLSVDKTELVLPFSFLFSLSSFEEMYCFLLWLCCCSSDFGSVSLSVTVFGDVLKSFSKLIMGTGWISCCYSQVFEQLPATC